MFVFLLFVVLVSVVDVRCCRLLFVVYWLMFVGCRVLFAVCC